MPLSWANTKNKRVSVPSVLMDMSNDECSDNDNGSIDHEHASLELPLLQMPYTQVKMDH